MVSNITVHKTTKPASLGDIMSCLQINLTAGTKRLRLITLMLANSLNPDQT